MKNIILNKMERIHLHNKRQSPTKNNDDENTIQQFDSDDEQPL